MGLIGSVNINIHMDLYTTQRSMYVGRQSEKANSLTSYIYLSHPLLCNTSENCFKGTLPQNVFILKSGDIGNINFFFKWVESFLFIFCVAEMEILSKFAPHMEERTFARPMEYSIADFALHLEWRHSSRTIN